MYQVYQITLNDTLNSIAERFKISVDEIYRLNGNKSYIPGEYIVLPNINTYYDEYIVKQGDNIYKIAAEYNIDPNMLILMNGLNKDDYIYPNEIVLVPKEGYSIYVTNDNSTLNDLINIGNLDKILENNKIYLLPNQTILYQKEN